MAFRLLIRGCLKRHFLETPLNALWKQILLPTAIVWFVSFLDTNAAASARWPMLAVALAVWLLFANSVNYGGMVLWHERWLLRQRVVPGWVLLAAAELVPIGLFVVQLSLVCLAMRASSFSGGVVSVETLIAGGIAAASGLGAGILAARLTGYRPGFAHALPKLLLASLVLTPVFYSPSALGGLRDAWCLANPLCVATELGHTGVSFQAESLPRYAIPIACALSGAILCWGLLTLRMQSTSFADEHV